MPCASMTQGGSCSSEISFRLSRAGLDFIPVFLFRLYLSFSAQGLGLIKGPGMRYTDVAIVGGGLAGSMAAAMLGRAGIQAVLIDPHPVYPPELRCEKLGGEQLELLRRTGLAEPTLRATTMDGEVWEARFGYLVAKKPSDQHGIMYDTLVNTVRAQIPAGVETIFAKASAITSSDERQKIELSNGDDISARLVVL